MERLTDAVAHARRALPFVEHAPGRDLDRTLRIPMPAARMVTLDIGADHLPVFDAPSGNQPSEAMTLAESLLTHARTLQAGAHLLIEPKGRVIETGTGVPALQVVPMGLEVVRAAPFAVVTDPDGDLDPENPGTAALTPLASVLVGDRIDRPDDLEWPSAHHTENADKHALTGMNGLILGVDVTGRDAREVCGRRASGVTSERQPPLPDSRCRAGERECS